MNATDISLTQNPKTAYRVIADEAFVIDLDTDMLYSLNAVGALIWDMSSDKTKIKDIIDGITDGFEVERSVAKEDCLEFVRAFVERGLLIADADLKED